MTDAQLRADKAYKSKTKTITVRFKPDEIDIYDKVIKESGNEGIMPFVKRILKEYTDQR